jgi:hypothetical protein
VGGPKAAAVGRIWASPSSFRRRSICPCH